MTYSADNLRLILGLKLKQFRQKKGLSLKELAAAAGLSISFLSEIEKGKKYPKPEKLMSIAGALDVAFDDLVSLKVDKDLDPLTSLLESPFLKEFPFDIFGITARDLMDLVTTTPNKAGAFLRTFLELGQTYDMRVEHFLLAALRSYQKMNQNYFGEIERAVDRFVTQRGWVGRQSIEFEELREIFSDLMGSSVEESGFERFPALKVFRSIWLNSDPPRLVINQNLLPSQKAFILGRELGYEFLGLKERTSTSSWIKVESFEQVLNNFRASYFAGALLINRSLLQEELRGFFRRKRWDTDLFVKMMSNYNATPEMFLYRLSQIIPKFFGLNEIYYVRFSNKAGSERFRITKELNMSRVVVPHGIGLNEHYCRRWQGIRLLLELAEKQQQGSASPQIVSAQRSHFVDGGVELFDITLARPLALTEGTNSSISLGFAMNDDFKSVVKFWQDPAVAKMDVNETCERCGLSSSACSERAGAADLYDRKHTQLVLENTLQDFLHEAEAGEAG